MKLLSMFKLDITREIQGQLEAARQFGMQAKSSLEQTQKQRDEMRGQLQDLSARFHQLEMERNVAVRTLEDSKSSLEHQLQQMVM